MSYSSERLEQMAKIFGVMGGRRVYEMKTASRKKCFMIEDRPHSESYTLYIPRGVRRLNFSEDSKREPGRIEYWKEAENGSIKPYFSAQFPESISTLKVVGGEDLVDLSYAFYGLQVYNSLDFSEMDTSNVTSMKYMFREVLSFGIKLGGKFNTSKVTDMTGMFMQADITGDINFDELDTHNVTEMKYMFAGATAGVISGTVDMRNITSIRCMFADSDLKECAIKMINTTKLRSTEGMFEFTKTKHIVMDKWNMNRIENMKRMFMGCAIGVMSIRGTEFGNQYESRKQNRDEMFRFSKIDQVENSKIRLEGFTDCKLLPRWNKQCKEDEFDEDLEISTRIMRIGRYRNKASYSYYKAEERIYPEKEYR